MGNRKPLSDAQIAVLRDALPGVIARLTADGIKVVCHCGTRMRLRASRWGYFYGCEGTHCDGTHGAHPDGRPLGTPGDNETKEARIQAHASFDKLWSGPDPLVPSRKGAYAAMQKHFGITDVQGHISRMTKEQAKKVQEWADFLVNNKVKPE